METSNEKPCLYCGKLFIPQRITKKYCCNTCKQMDYLKRNELLPNSNINYMEETQKFHNENEPEKQSEKIFVKEIPFFTGIDNNEKQITGFDERKLDFTVKQNASDNEKSDISVKYDGENDFTVSRSSSNNVKPGLTVKYIDDKYDFTVKQDTVKSNFTIKDENQKLYASDTGKKTEKAYNYVNAKFFEFIEEHLNKAWSYKLMKPHEHWSEENVSKVKWVSVRVRCLFESLLRLSRTLTIDRESLTAITHAFILLTQSREFRTLPRDYPYSRQVTGLKDKLIGIFNETKGQQILHFRMAPEKKALLMAMRYEMASYVPKVKFSQLTFGEMQIPNDKQEDEQDD